jgi:ribosomal protein L24E
VIPSLHPLTNRFRRRMAAAVAVAVTALLPLAVPTVPTAQASDAVRKADAGAGYWMVASDGGIFSFGSAPFLGSTGNVALNKPIVGMAATSTGKGYWFVAADGGIFTFGDAKFYGSTGNVALNKPIVGMAPTPSGNGYWFVASDGGIFTFGDAKFYGSAGDVKLAKPITAMAASPSGNGYWFTASDGGVFSYGDAKFAGAQPSGSRTVAAMVPAPDGGGYWMASSTGELLAFGTAANLGGLTQKPNKPIVGMTAVPAVASGPSGTNPTVPGGGGNPTTTTGPTTVTTLPPYTGPMRFSSTALHSWGTPADTDHGRVNSSGVTVYPYSQKVLAVEEINDRVYIGGEFKDMHQNNHPKTPTMSGIPMDYLAELDTNGNPVPGSAFNATVSLNGPVRALLRSPDGKRLYVGGEFSKVNGANRARLVALDPATGQIDTSFNPPEPNAYVSALALMNDKLYIGGGFATLNGDGSRPGLAALTAATGAIDTGFTPPPRYIGKFVGHTGIPCDDPAGTDPAVPDYDKCTKPLTTDPMGTVEALEITRDGQYLVVGGSFLHFGSPYNPALCTGSCTPGGKSDTKNHNHGGLITLHPVTGALTTWQPENNRPVFDLASYQGDPKSQGINASQLIFAATGGAGGRVVAWVPGGSKDTPLWRGNMDGDAMSVAVTQDRVYVVGHFDHTVADPNDPCLEIDPATGGVHCDDGTSNRHLAAFDVRGDIQNGKNTGKALIDGSFRAQADTSEGPYKVYLGANRMYVGGNFTDISNFPLSTGCTDPSCVQDRQPGFAVYPPLT